MRRFSAVLAAFALAGLSLPLGGCSGVQSALAPMGREAAEIVPMFWTVTGISAAVMALVTVLVAVALFGPAGWRAWLGRAWIIWGGGLVLPVIVLTFLFGYGLVVMQAGAARSASATGPGVTVAGERWWWRVTYETANGKTIESANELHLPVGEPVETRLTSDNVIHSFWAPRLAGKLDMIPGRTNVLTLQADKAGISRGQCAEYCGGAHALMGFYVVAQPADEYRKWLAHEAEPAREPTTDKQRLGKSLFMDSGCGACHTIRGTEANGKVGPDLTHVGSRHSIAAAALPDTVGAFAAWIVDNQHIKPENLMPEYDVYSGEQLTALATYLKSLE